MSKQKSLKERAKKDQGRMKVLMAIGYKKGMIYVRQIDEEIFIWDAIYENKLYSSYINITLNKGKKKMPKKIVNEARQMCYAGAAATIDYQMGEGLDKMMEENVKLFQSSVEGRQNAKSI